MKALLRAAALAVLASITGCASVLPGAFADSERARVVRIESMKEIGKDLDLACGRELAANRAAADSYAVLRSRIGRASVLRVARVDPFDMPVSGDTVVYSRSDCDAIAVRAKTSS